LENFQFERVPGRIGLFRGTQLQMQALFQAFSEVDRGTGPSFGVFSFTCKLIGAARYQAVKDGQNQKPASTSARFTG
jgi:hypothetical protein